MTTLLPPAATALERALEALGDARLGDVDVPLRALWSAQDCPPDILPWLAWGLSLDSWDTAWPLPMRRARIASAIPVQSRKGTRRSIAEVVASFGGTMTIREWHQQDPQGIPHTFQLVLSLGGFGAPGADFIEAVVAEVSRTKPARSHFTLIQAVNFSGGVGLVPALRAAVFNRICGTAPAETIPPNAITLSGSPLTLDGEFLTIGA